MDSRKIATIENISQRRGNYYFDGIRFIVILINNCRRPVFQNKLLNAVNDA